MIALGCDTAATNLDYAAVKQHGISFVCRYASTPGNPKNLTLAEAQRARDAGVRIVSLFETTAQRALEGRAAGIKDATAAAEQFYACGMPFFNPIYYTVDFDMRMAQWPDVESYFQGLVAGSVHYSVAAYGGLLACTMTKSSGLATMTYQTTAWSHTVKAASISLYQTGVKTTIGGVSVDMDQALTATYGGWLPVPPTSQPPIIPPHTPPAKHDWMTTIMDRLPELREGAHDPVAGQAFVRRAQAILRDVAGITVGDTGVDGVFGPLTLGAVKAFQQTRHLAVDGIIGPKTWSYLITGTAL